MKAAPSSLNTTFSRRQQTPDNYLSALKLSKPQKRRVVERHGLPTTLTPPSFCLYLYYLDFHNKSPDLPPVSEGSGVTAQHGLFYHSCIGVHRNQQRIIGVYLPQLGAG